MNKKLICVVTGFGLALSMLHAQTSPATSGKSNAQKEIPSPSTAQLFYQVLIGEISATNGDAGAAVSLLLDAARKTNDAQLYKRATDLALQARAGDSALQAAKAWRQAQPKSPDANRYTLQILLALNRVAETSEPLKSLIELTPEVDRATILSALPSFYARAGDKKLAAAVVEQSLVAYLGSSKLAASAWTTVGQLRLAAGDAPAALEAVRQAHAAQAQSQGAIWLALDLMDPKLPDAESLVKKYLATAGHQAPGPIRLAYARNLLDSQRFAEGYEQLQIVTREQPDFADGWLLIGTLQLQDKQLPASEASFKRYVELSQKQPDSNGRGLAQAYLSLSQIAEQSKDLPGAEAWLNKISNPEVLVQAQSRRASLLARQGKLAEGRQLLRQIPERNAADARLKLMAEIGLLRDFKQYQGAHDLLAQAVADSPEDVDLVYEQAMMAEKLGRLPDMEALLRRAIAIKPDYSAAYNALGYSLADRGLRLPEAKQLIQKALQIAPTDPFIQDSLGWVEFRLGNRVEALKIFEGAFKTKPDAEIGAHLGEVLWSLGERDRAFAVWRQALEINAENETLLETLKRLNVKL
jgi:tetratricopeptide (TPR) repeat protein